MPITMHNRGAFSVKSLWITWAALLGTLVFASYLTLSQAADETTARNRSDLKAITATIRSQIEAYLNERRNDARLLASRKDIASLLARSRLDADARHAIDTALFPTQQIYGYHSVTLLDTTLHAVANEEQYEMIKTHVERGYEILKDVAFPIPIAEIIRQHHERLDGSGYPRGLIGSDILPEARILAVADVLESMASHRPYRPALGMDAALQELESHQGVWFDPEVVATIGRMVRQESYRLPD